MGESEQLTTVGEHYWGLMDEKLVVVLRGVSGFHVCGPWEGECSFNEVTILVELPKPGGFGHLPLYYGN